MKEKGYTFIQANPLHHGHMALFTSLLEHVDELDVFLAQRQRPHVMPYCIRKEALERALGCSGFGHRVNILSLRETTRGSICQIGPKPYDILGMGSDIANRFSTENPGLRDYEREHFLSFPSFVVVQRPNHLITDEAACSIRQRVRSLIIHPPQLELSATDIRNQHRQGADIREHLPDGVWEGIHNDVSVFSNEK